MTAPEDFGGGLRPLRGEEPRNAPKPMLIPLSGPLAVSLFLIVAGAAGVSITVGVLWGVAIGLLVCFVIMLVIGVLVGFTS